MENNNTQPQKVSPDLIAVIQAAVDKKDQEKDVHWTVKVFGGALLSVIAIVIIGAFQSAFQNINDCQRNIQQQSAVILTKDEYNLRTKAIWDAVKDNNAQKTEIAALKERIKLLEQQVRDLNVDLQKLRDRLTAPAPVQPQPPQRTAPVPSQPPAPSAIAHDEH